MITLPTDFIQNIIINAGGIMKDAMPLALLLIGVPIALWIIEGIVDYASHSEERKIGRALSGRLGENEELSVDEWKEVYRNKGREYSGWVKSTKITEQEFLKNYQDYKKL
jgi:hypothetical protein